MPLLALLTFGSLLGFGVGNAKGAQMRARRSPKLLRRRNRAAWLNRRFNAGGGR